MRNRYKLTFYQCGVQGIPSEYFTSLRLAQLAGNEFIAGLLPMAGHRREGSMYKYWNVFIRDYSGATEASARITLA